MNARHLGIFAIFATLFILILVTWTVIGQIPVAHSQEPLSGKIAFSSNRDGNYEIYVMNADGSGQTNLTNNSAYDNRPAWSPDGTKIAFTRNSNGFDEIYVMKADGSEQINLTNNPTANDYRPTWSPDGTKIAFVSDRDSATGDEIYVMNANGSGQTRLTNNPAVDDWPAWSPNGSKIAFTSDRDGNDEVYIMNTDGSGQTNLTNSPSSDDYRPAWSPDSTKLIFTSTRDGNGEIYIMNTNGSGQTNLTDCSGWDYLPAWSPDGTRIVFTSFRDGNEEIYIMNADGSAQARLTNTGFSNLHPAWQPATSITYTVYMPLISKSDSKTVLIPVQPRPQEHDDFCGEVCVQQAMYYFGRPISQMEINQAGGLDGSRGLWSDEIVTALENLNVSHEWWKYSPDYWAYVDFLKSKLDQGHPVLVGVKLYPGSHPEWFTDHFILLVGYNADSFIYNDSEFQCKRSFAAFKDGSVDEYGSRYTLTNPYNLYYGVEFKGP